MTDMLLNDVRLPDGAAVDVAISRGRIERVGPNLQAPAHVAREAGAGLLLLPGLVEGHTHLDKTTWESPWYVNQVGAGVDRPYRQRAGLARRQRP